jgi:hypothetical protein
MQYLIYISFNRGSQSHLQSMISNCLQLQMNKDNMYQTDHWEIITKVSKSHLTEFFLKHEHCYKDCGQISSPFICGQRNTL